MKEFQPKLFSVLKNYSASQLVKDIVAGIIVVVYFPTFPALAFDTERVVALSGKFTLSCPTLKETLCEGDAGRNLPAVHLLDGDVLVLVDILLITLVPLDLRMNSE